MQWADCVQCGKKTTDTLKIKKKWVSFGPVPSYQGPIIKSCCKGCQGDHRNDQAKYYAVLDETMNTHRDFVRVKGQSGYIDHNGERIKCQGWMSANEIGVPYHVSQRYKEYY